MQISIDTAIKCDLYWNAPKDFLEVKQGNLVISKSAIELPGDVALMLNRITSIEYVFIDNKHLVKISTISNQFYYLAIQNETEAGHRYYAEKLQQFVHDIPQGTQSSEATMQCSSDEDAGNVPCIGEETFTSADPFDPLDDKQTDTQALYEEKSETIHSEEKKRSAIRCYASMWAHGFTQNARTTQRDFMLASWCHLVGFSPALIVFFYALVIRPSRSEDYIALALLVQGVGYALIYFIISFIPYTSMLVRRMVDSYATDSLEKLMWFRKWVKRIVFTPIVVFLTNFLYFRSVLVGDSFIVQVMFFVPPVILAVIILLGFIRPSKENPCNKFL